MSPAHFARRFRGLFGETPHRYLQRRRIERACAWLRDSRAPVTRIALAVGYESPGTFSRTFAAVMGQSPSAYRASAMRHEASVPVCFTTAWTRVSG
jgi:AraC-like DNA-binding protein